MPLETLGFNGMVAHGAAGNTAVGANASLISTASGSGKGVMFLFGLGAAAAVVSLAVGAGVAGWITAQWISTRKQEARMLSYKVRGP